MTILLFFPSLHHEAKILGTFHLSPRLYNYIQDYLFAEGFSAGSKDAGLGGNERIKACIRPGEEQRTDKASVMIIAVCQLPRRRKRRMRLLAPEKGHKG